MTGKTTTVAAKMMTAWGRLWQRGGGSQRRATSGRRADHRRGEESEARYMRGESRGEGNWAEGMPREEGKRLTRYRRRWWRGAGGWL